MPEKRASIQGEHLLRIFFGGVCGCSPGLGLPKAEVKRLQDMPESNLGCVLEQKTFFTGESTSHVCPLEECGAAPWHLMTLKQMRGETRRCVAVTLGGCWRGELSPEGKIYVSWHPWRSLGLLPGMSGPCSRAQDSVGHVWEESWADAREESVLSGRKNLWVCSLEECGAATYIR